MEGKRNYEIKYENIFLELYWIKLVQRSLKVKLDFDQSSKIL